MGSLPSLSWPLAESTGPRYTTCYRKTHLEVLPYVVWAFLAVFGYSTKNNSGSRSTLPLYGNSDKNRTFVCTKEGDFHGHRLSDDNGLRIGWLLNLDLIRILLELFPYCRSSSTGLVGLRRAKVCLDPNIALAKLVGHVVGHGRT